MAGSRDKKKSNSIAVVIVLIAVLAYPLSYAPVVRMVRWRPSWMEISRAYKPIDWLIDNTSLRHPLFWWADVWGVRPYFEKLASLRDRLERERRYFQQFQQ